MHMASKYLSPITGVTVHIQRSEQTHQLLLISTPTEEIASTLVKYITLQSGRTVISALGI